MSGVAVDEEVEVDTFFCLSNNVPYTLYTQTQEWIKTFNLAANNDKWRMESNDTGAENMSDIKRFITPHNDIEKKAKNKNERTETKSKQAS